MGCTRQTVRRYLDLYPELRETAQDEGERALDVTEPSLFLDTDSGDPEARQYLLLTHGRDRDYILRREVTGATGQPLNPAEQHNPVVVIDGNKTEYLEKLRQMRELARGGQNARLDAMTLPVPPPAGGDANSGNDPA